MNKKSAMAIAAGLVAAMLSGIVALSISLGSNGTAVAAGPTAQKPIVRTTHQTVTVTRKPKDQNLQPRVVVIGGSGSGSSVSTGSESYGDDDGYGDDGYGDDAYEGGGDDGGFSGGDGGGDD